MDNVETTIVSFSVCDNTNSSHVTPTSDHSDHTGIESDEIGNFSSCKINLDCVVDLDGWVWVSDTIILSAYFQVFFQPNIDPTSD